MADYNWRTSIVPSGAMTGTNTIKSQVMSLLNCASGSFQATWTGTPTGTFSVYVSNDYVPCANGNPATPANAGTWDNLGATVSPEPAGSAGSTYIPVYASGAKYIQLWYTNSTGSGVLGGTFVGKNG